MPAAAVIPAPIAYIKVVAVKKLVVEPWVWSCGPADMPRTAGADLCASGKPVGPCALRGGPGLFTLKKLECSKQADSLKYISME